MASKKKPKKKREFGVVERARLGARQAVGPPRPTRAIPSQKHKPVKHKKTLIDQELAEF